MHVFLLWSGGIQSTALLYANLKLGHRVTTLEYTEAVDPNREQSFLDSVNVKIKREIRARSKIAEGLRGEFPKAVWSRVPTPWPVLTNLHNVRFWLQPATHLYNAAMRLCHEDVVQLGYVPGDSVCETFGSNPKPNLDYLYQIWDAYLRTTRSHDHPVPIRVPFLDPEDHPEIVGIVGNTKTEFINRLPDYILDNFYCCESVEDHPETRWCGKCVPCETMYLALMALSKEALRDYALEHNITTNQELGEFIKEGLESWRK